MDNAKKVLLGIASGALVLSVGGTAHAESSGLAESNTESRGRTSVDTDTSKTTTGAADQQRQNSQQYQQSQERGAQGGSIAANRTGQSAGQQQDASQAADRARLDSSYEADTSGTRPGSASAATTVGSEQGSGSRTGTGSVAVGSGQ